MAQARATVLGIPFEAIIDTGASDTVVSHPVVRKLGLQDKLEHNYVTFLVSKRQGRDSHGHSERAPYWSGQVKTTYSQWSVTPW